MLLSLQLCIYTSTAKYVCHCYNARTTRTTRTSVYMLCSTCEAILFAWKFYFDLRLHGSICSFLPFLRKFIQSYDVRIASTITSTCCILILRSFELEYNLRISRISMFIRRREENLRIKCKCNGLKPAQTNIGIYLLLPHRFE